jgi:phytoene dehydrogenase-like protein
MIILICTVLLGALVGFFFLRPSPFAAIKPCPIPKDESCEEEDVYARVRLTAGRLKKAQPSGGFDVIVVGAGPSGLVCAASLARLGYKCCVLEQGEELGGGSHVFSLLGYEFETGIHYLGKDLEMERMLSFASHGKLKMAPIGTKLADGVVHDEIVVDGESYMFTAGAGSFRKMLKSRFPDSVQEIDRFVDLVEVKRSAAYKASAAWFFRLKAVGFLPSSLRGFLQRWLGRQFWLDTQKTSEALLQDMGIDPTGKLGSVLLGQYSDAC